MDPYGAATGCLWIQLGNSYSHRCGDRALSARTGNRAVMFCITPELKRKGYGKVLLDYSLAKASDLGFGAVLFEGSIRQVVPI